MESRAYVVLYDRDCGICSAFSRLIRVVDMRRRIRIETIQSSRHLIRDVPAERVLDAFHVVTRDGRSTTGGDAVPTLIEALPLGIGLARILRASTILTAAVHASYRFLTRFRDRLVCRVAPSATSADSDP